MAPKTSATSSESEVRVVHIESIFLSNGKHTATFEIPQKIDSKPIEVKFVFFEHTVEVSIKGLGSDLETLKSPFMKRDLTKDEHVKMDVRIQ